MKVLHVNAGAEMGGGKVHLISLLSQTDKNSTDLLVFEEGLIASEARELGIKVTVLKQKSRFDLTVLKSFKSIIQDNDYDIIHTHGARSNLFVSLLRNLNAKWVVTVHSDPNLDFMGRGVLGKSYTLLNNYSLKKADYLITVSSKIESSLRDKGIPASKLSTINNGIQFKEYSKPDIKKDNLTFTMTYIARLHPIKRHDYLLEAIKESSLSDFTLNLVGDGEAKNAIVNKINQLGLQKNVILHGYLTSNQINSVLENTDISLLTSMSETFPLVLLESANYQVPFISTDVGDVKRIDPHNNYSWIVPVNNKKQLINAIEEAYEFWKVNKLQERGYKLYSEVASKYTLKNMHDQVITIYQQVKKTNDNLR